MTKWSARLYDKVMGMLSASKLQTMRKKVIAEANGNVLEIGAGTGINFPLYIPNKVQMVHAIEPDPHHLHRAEVKREQSKVPIHLHEAKAENLPFQQDEFDTVICMLVFCTIPEPLLAMKEIERVTRSGGTVLFLEHVKVERPIIRTTQNMLNPLWKRVAGGCHLNRNTKMFIENSSLEIIETKTFYKDIFTYIRCQKP